MESLEAEIGAQVVNPDNGSAVSGPGDNTSAQEHSSVLETIHEWPEFHTKGVQRAIAREREIRRVHNRFIKKRLRVNRICAQSAVILAAQHTLMLHLNRPPEEIAH